MLVKTHWIKRWAWVLGCGVAATSANASEFKKVVTPFFEKHCVECHGGKQTKADLDLKQLKDDSQILQQQKLWKGIVQQVTSGEMPPKKHPSKPTLEEKERFAAEISGSIKRAEAKLPMDPGRVTVRRLNRKEYNNTIRDLMHVDFNPAENFPADDIGHGFDNIGDVLSISPVHLERYLDAAESIIDRALPHVPPKPSNRTTYSIFLEPGGYRSENGTRPVTNSIHELFVKHKLEVAGDYTFRVRAAGTNAPSAEPPKIKLFAGDRELLETTITNRPGKWRELEVKLSLPAGEHRFAARFINPETNAPDRVLYINEFKVIGPADTRTTFQRQVADIRQQAPKGKGALTDKERDRHLLSWFLTRTFRRPPTVAELDRYSQVMFQEVDGAPDRWETGFRQVVKSVLCSPKFLFKLEPDSQPNRSKPHPIDEYQLASRLSYFLWSTLPDDELLSLAGSGKLSKQIESQVRRMLKDPRSEALVANFGLQWLQLERLRTLTPDPTLFPTFNDNLRKSMLRETELFLAEIVREDRSILDLVDADFTYLNEPLAKHYGVMDTQGNMAGQPEKRTGGEKIRGKEFVRVSLADGSRGGLLTQASVLTVTSNPTRTSPVKRGKWILEQILGTPPPPAPPGVLGLEAQKQLTGTLRQRMEQHRSNPACASCHLNMDSVGFAFENFDGIGRFRTQDTEGAIDPSGVLPDGKSFKGPAELKLILKDKKDLVARNITEKLLTYGLGRGLEFYDERAINKILGEVSRQQYRFSSLMISIVQSDPFRLRRGRETPEAPAADKPAAKTAQAPATDAQLTSN